MQLSLKLSFLFSHRFRAIQFIRRVATPFGFAQLEQAEIKVKGAIINTSEFEHIPWAKEKKPS